MKTLYLSDLDGTLLRSDERVSAYSAGILNRFIREGGCFSYATARSIVSASRVTAGLEVKLPVICTNGAFMHDGVSGGILLANYFSAKETEYLSDILGRHKIYPVVSARVDGAERMSYTSRRLSDTSISYLGNRIGDPRRHEANDIAELYSGGVFRVMCMDEDAALSPVYGILKTDVRFSCVYQKAAYGEGAWLDILPAGATKAEAALRLKTKLGCDRLVVFGDERNDIPLFSAADESYAVSNAVPELKEIATAVIGSNDEDSVARWIEENAVI